MRGVSPVTLEGITSTFTIDRPAPNVVVLVIEGRDAGEHGDHPFHELEKHLGQGPLQLFIDARSTRGAIMEVSNKWALWLRGHRAELECIHMLTGSSFVRLTADFVKRWADLGDLMRIYTDPGPFDEELATSTTGVRA